MANRTGFVIAATCAALVFSTRYVLGESPSTVVLTFAIVLGAVVTGQRL